MNYYQPVLLIAILLFGLTISQNTTNHKTKLSFAETLYVRLSKACRAILDLTQGNTNESLNTVKIVYLKGNKMSVMPINEAFAALTQPAVFDITKQTKVIIHGFRDNSGSVVPHSLAEAYNDKNIFNVLIVDAEELLGKKYISSVHNARLVGKRLGNLLANLEKFGANAEDFHLLGISLGAHIAGWAGKYFHHYKGRRLGRITGLDPAGPCFTHAFSEQRLDKTDANYVDVIHSNRLIQGVIEDLGHSDFYLNGGGPTQPGCFMPSCSHLRAAEVYIESIVNPKSFIGVKCLSWKHFLSNACEKDYMVLGYGSSTATRGRYYLKTNSKSPFGLGMNGTNNDDKNEMTMEDFLGTFNLT